MVGCVWVVCWGESQPVARRVGESFPARGERGGLGREFVLGFAGSGASVVADGGGMRDDERQWRWKICSRVLLGQGEVTGCPKCQ